MRRSPHNRGSSFNSAHRPASGVRRLRASQRIIGQARFTDTLRSTEEDGTLGTIPSLWGGATTHRRRERHIVLLFRKVVSCPSRWAFDVIATAVVTDSNTVTGSNSYYRFEYCYSLFEGVIELFSRCLFPGIDTESAVRTCLRIDRRESFQFQMVFRLPCKIQRAYLAQRME